MCMEGWVLQRICNFCIMWSWANTCDEHVEREISKTIVKRRKLCYFPLKNTHTTLNWLVLLSAQAHAYSSAAFQKEMIQLTFLFCWRPVPSIANVASHRGCCSCRTTQSPQQGAAENQTQAKMDTLLLGQRYLLQVVPKLGRSGHMTASVQRGLCQALPERWQTSTGQNVNLCAPQLSGPCYSPTSFLPHQAYQHISYQSNPWEDFLCSSPSWSSMFLLPLCLLSPSLLLPVQFNTVKSSQPQTYGSAGWDQQSILLSTCFWWEPELKSLGTPKKCGQK